MNNVNEQGQAMLSKIRTERSWLMTGSAVCVLFIALAAWGVRALWRVDEMPVDSTFKEQMMHRKSKTMADILDGLVRGNMRHVERSAEHMEFIGNRLNWYSSGNLYQSNDEIFRNSTADLIDAAQRRDHDSAKEAALRLERSCIECHALINRTHTATP